MNTFHHLPVREYFETHGATDGQIVWLWERDVQQDFQLFKVVNGENVYAGTLSAHNNDIFIPAELFPNAKSTYVLLDLYCITTGGVGSVAYGSGITGGYLSGGSGACLEMRNVKLRMRDYARAPIKYQATAISKFPGSSGRAGAGGVYLLPTNDYMNLNNFNLSAVDYASENVYIPPRMSKNTILSMASGGNSKRSRYDVYIGNGAGIMELPSRSVIQRHVRNLELYERDKSFHVGDYFRYSTNPELDWGQPYKATSDFVATEWSVDVDYCEPIPVYDNDTEYNVGDIFWAEYEHMYDGYYTQCVRKFKGDFYNNVVGEGDWLFNKSDTIVNFRLGKDGARGYEAPPGLNRPDFIYPESRITPLNRLWVEKSLNWGFGGDGDRYSLSPTGGAGIVAIFKGFAE